MHSSPICSQVSSSLPFCLPFRSIHSARVMPLFTCTAQPGQKSVCIIVYIHLYVFPSHEYFGINAEDSHCSAIFSIPLSAVDPVLCYPCLFFPASGSAAVGTVLQCCIQLVPAHSSACSFVAKSSQVPSRFRLRHLPAFHSPFSIPHPCHYHATCRKSRLTYTHQCHQSDF